MKYRTALAMACTALLGAGTAALAQTEAPSRAAIVQECHAEATQRKLVADAFKDYMTKCTKTKKTLRSRSTDHESQERH